MHFRSFPFFHFWQKKQTSIYSNYGLQHIMCVRITLHIVLVWRDEPCCSSTLGVACYIHFTPCQFQLWSCLPVTFKCEQDASWRDINRKWPVMDKMLILWLSEFTKLYNTTLYSYHYFNKKITAVTTRTKNRLCRQNDGWTGGHAFCCWHKPKLHLCAQGYGSYH